MIIYHCVSVSQCHLKTNPEKNIKENCILALYSYCIIRGTLHMNVSETFSGFH